MATPAERWSALTICIVRRLTRANTCSRAGEGEALRIGNSDASVDGRGGVLESYLRPTLGGRALVAVDLTANASAAEREFPRLLLAEVLHPDQPTQTRSCAPREVALRLCKPSTRARDRLPHCLLDVQRGGFGQREALAVFRYSALPALRGRPSPRPAGLGVFGWPGGGWHVLRYRSGASLRQAARFVACGRHPDRVQLTSACSVGEPRSTRRHALRELDLLQSTQPSAATEVPCEGVRLPFVSRNCPVLTA